MCCNWIFGNTYNRGCCCFLDWAITPGYNIFSPLFYVSADQVFWRHCGKRRNCSLREISPFPTAFSTRLENFLSFSSSLKLSSVNFIEFERVLDLSFGNRLKRADVEVFNHQRDCNWFTVRVCLSVCLPILLDNRMNYDVDWSFHMQKNDQLQKVSIQIRLSWVETFANERKKCFLPCTIHTWLNIMIIFPILKRLTLYL